MSAKVRKAQKPSSYISVGVTDINVVETTFKWVVYNFSFYRNGFKNKLNSPVFETTNNKTITWCMELEPNKSNIFNNLNINLKLVQSNLPKVHANFEFMIINKNGEPEKSTSTKSATFHTGSSKSSKILMSHGYFKKNIQRILPNDTLTILCKIKANLDQGATNTMKANAVGPAQKMQTDLNNLTEATAKMNIEDSSQLNSETFTAAVSVAKKANTVGSQQKIQAELNNLTEATAKMSTNVAANAYAPHNVAYSLPPPYKPGIARFASTGFQYKSYFGSSDNSAATPPNSSTLSPHCGYCNNLLHNCECYPCKYCKFPSQNCKCIHCKICKLHIFKCKCMRCEHCDNLVKHCKCKYCIYCDSHVDECDCEICDYCDSYMQDCECPRCFNCDLHVEDCDCDENYCTYCGEHLEYCDCDYCPDCDCLFDECECNEFGNNHYYY